ncbi:MAG: FHA domain-containing protein [Armatimonadetes bacterium]|nr:FHA domain-containing protein [Armatimonadota bacterium]
MPDLTLSILRFAFLGIIYLFVFEVFRRFHRDLLGVSSGGRYRLRVLSSKAPGLTAGDHYDLLSVTMLVRSEQCHIRIVDRMVSASHCRVTCDRGKYVLTDLGSTNGTLLNGKRVKRPIPLKTGDRLQVGEVLFEVTPIVDGVLTVSGTR